MSFDAGLAVCLREQEGEGESGELECISGLKQVVHCRNSHQGRREFKGRAGGYGGELSGGGGTLLLGNTCGISSPSP